MRIKDEAIIAGGKLLGKMEGDTWRLRVWENLGWHYSVESPPFTVFPSGACKNDREPRRFTCLMTDKSDYCGTGSGMWSNNSTFADPNEAVRHELAAAKAVLEGLIKVMEQAQRVLIPVPDGGW